MTSPVAILPPVPTAMIPSGRPAGVPPAGLFTGVLESLLAAVPDDGVPASAGNAAGASAPDAGGLAWRFQPLTTAPVALPGAEVRPEPASDQKSDQKEDKKEVAAGPAGAASAVAASGAPVLPSPAISADALVLETLVKDVPLEKDALVKDVTGQTEAPAAESHPAEGSGAPGKPAAKAVPALLPMPMAGLTAPSPAPIPPDQPRAAGEHLPAQPVEAPVEASPAPAAAAPGTGTPRPAVAPDPRLFLAGPPARRFATPAPVVSPAQNSIVTEPGPGTEQAAPAPAAPVAELPGPVETLVKAKDMAEAPPVADLAERPGKPAAEPTEAPAAQASPAPVEDASSSRTEAPPTPVAPLAAPVRNPIPAATGSAPARTQLRSRLTAAGDTGLRARRPLQPAAPPVQPVRLAEATIAEPQTTGRAATGPVEASPMEWTPLESTSDTSSPRPDHREAPAVPQTGAVPFGPAPPPTVQAAPETRPRADALRAPAGLPADAQALAPDPPAAGPAPVVPALNPPVAVPYAAAPTAGPADSAGDGEERPRREAPAAGQRWTSLSQWLQPRTAAPVAQPLAQDAAAAPSPAPSAVSQLPDLPTPPEGVQVDRRAANDGDRAALAFGMRLTPAAPAPARPASERAPQPPAEAPAPETSIPREPASPAPPAPRARPAQPESAPAPEAYAPAAPAHGRFEAAHVGPVTFAPPAAERTPTPMPAAERPAPAAPLEARPIDPPRTAPAHDISLRVADAGQRVDIRVTERAGEIEVSVRTPDRDLASALRQDLPELSATLERGGLRSETWQPAMAGGADRSLHLGAARESASAQDTPGQPGERQPPPDSQQQRQPHRRAPEPTEETPESRDRKDFAWLVSSLHSNR